LRRDLRGPSDPRQGWVPQCYWARGSALCGALAAGQTIAPASGKSFDAAHAKAKRLFTNAPADEHYRNTTPPEIQKLVEFGGLRTLLMVPLRTDNAFLGVITAYRLEVQPFTDKQITLLQRQSAVRSGFRMRYGPAQVSWPHLRPQRYGGNARAGRPHNPC
jgi:GAF domain-containing protein